MSPVGPPLHQSSPKRNLTQRHSYNPSSLKVVVVNIQSIMAKKTEWLELFSTIDPDIVIGNETWLHPNILDNEFTPQGYKTIRKDRADGYGGTIILLKNSIISEELETAGADLELCATKVNMERSHPLIICSVYRAPNRDITYQEKLCTCLRSISEANPSAHIWVAGDFNLPDINWNCDSIQGNRNPVKVNEMLLNTVQDLDLDQIVKFPTRKQNTLDLFLTNRPSLVNRCEPIPGISDHDTAIFINIVAKAQLAKPPKRKILIWKRGDFESLRKEIATFSQSLTESHNPNTPVDQLWECIKSTLHNATDKYVPSKMSSSRYNQSWITRNIIKLTRRKAKYFRKAKSTNHPDDWKIYSEVRKRVKKECRIAQSNYLRDVIATDPNTSKKECTKKFWKYVKGLRKDSTGVSTLKRDGITYADAPNKSAILNDQFSAVFTQENLDTLPEVMGPSQYPDIPNLRIHQNGVLKLLKNLKPHKAPGPDNITPTILKETAREIAPALTLLFQASIDQQTIPKDWKTALITPIFKKGDRSKASNYRPVSLTSICSKMLEHIVHHHIMCHFDKYNILTSAQHGFRKRRSCESQLIATLQDLAKGIDDKSQIDAVLLDFSKAFDKVPHHRLSLKLDQYGVRGNILRWVTNFLSNRSQAVVCEGHKSQLADVVSGVPQGTVLGPLLFLAYINDMPDQVSSTIRLFADDALLYRRINTTDDAKILQRDLDALQTWENKWQMAFNPDKCEVLRVTTKKKHIINASYNIHGHTLQTVDKAKYLGVTIDSKLSFNAHIDNICKKANKTRAFIHRNTKECSRQIKTAAYNTLTRPLLEYSSSVWSPQNQTNIDKIQAVQRRAVRSVMGDWSTRRPGDPAPTPYHKGSPTEMQQHLKWVPLDERRAKAKVTIIYKIVKQLIDIPSEILSRNMRDTRQHNFKFHTIQTSCDAYKNSFFPSSINLWNNLSMKAVHSPSLDIFKANIRKIKILSSPTY